MSYRDEPTGERRILVVAEGGRITGYDRASGAPVWEHVVKFRVLGLDAVVGGACELAIHAGRVLAVVHDRLVCLDYASGALIGEVKLASVANRPTMLIDGDQLFVASGATVECFTLDGVRVWSTPRRLTSHGSALGFPGNVRAGDERGS